MNTKLIDIENISSWRKQLRNDGLKLVVTNGVFDILHCGHAKYLQEAASLGDILLVCLNDDEGVRQLKGPTRPVNCQEARAALLAALSCVGAVTIFHGTKATDILKAVEPDIYVKGGDYTVDTLDREEYAVLKACGAQINFIPFVAGYSTTNTIKKMTGNASSADVSAIQEHDWPAALNFIFNRRSIRQFQPRPLTPEQLKALLQAAMAAPSARATNPWQFLVVTEQSIRDSIAEIMPNGAFVKDAPATILVLGDINLACDGLFGYMAQDCSAAIQNILLAATALNLGTCWIGIFPRLQRMQDTSTLLKLPANIIPMGAIAVGWPAQEKPPRTNYSEDRIHFNRW